MVRLFALVVFTIVTVAPAVAAELTGTLAKIDSADEIVVGFADSAPPLSFIGKDGEPTGYSIDLCRRVIAAVKDRLGKPDLKVTFMPATVDTRVGLVADGTLDLECGTTTKTLSRLEKVDFTQLTFITGGSLLVRRGSGIVQLGDLAGRTVGVLEGTTTEAKLKEMLKDRLIDANVRAYDSHEAGMKAFDAKAIDGYAADQVILIGLGVTSAFPDELELLQELFSYEPLAFMVPRGDPAFKLVADRALSQIYRSDEIVTLYRKWFAGIPGGPPPLLVAAYRLNIIPD